ncbi:MAG TPA: RdgB/HAM1 family non-canonical purine NTP pyrophosphatase [Rhizobiales bacterium]|nr:RdgB/HAM1 family non-canonical purine NTP pyrophosphatase [Hyphomicrobiales bacterium]
MSRRIVLATGNTGKVRELGALLAQLDIEIIPQSEFDVPEADETGLTFVENAIIKARNAAAHTGLPAIADDSGLEVDFLKGAPGIYSSRFAGVNANSQDNVKKLLTEMKDVADAERSARFQCLLVFMAHDKDPTPLICQGTWEGSILHEQQGDGGFGYDPVFYVPTHDCASAELTAEIKNQLSHRGQALRKLAEAMQQ